MTGEYTREVELSDRTLRWEGSARFESDAGYFYYTFARRLFQDGKLLREKRWTYKMPRDHQ